MSTRAANGGRRPHEEILGAIETAAAPALSIPGIAARVPIHRRQIEAELFDLTESGQLVAYRSGDVVLFCFPEHYDDD
jgi:hypothetical protein